MRPTARFYAPMSRGMQAISARQRQFVPRGGPGRLTPGSRRLVPQGPSEDLADGGFGQFVTEFDQFRAEIGQSFDLRTLRLGRKLRQATVRDGMGAEFDQRVPPKRFELVPAHRCAVGLRLVPAGPCADLCHHSFDRCFSRGGQAAAESARRQ